MNFHLNIPKESLLNKTGGAGGFAIEMNTENEKYVNEVIADEIYGVLFMVFGTVIWAYGQFLVCAIK